MSSSVHSLGYHRLSLKSLRSLPIREGAGPLWSTIEGEYESYVEGNDGQHLVFVGRGGEDGDLLRPAPYNHRFTDAYTRMQYSKLKSFEAGAIEEYDDPYVVTFPLTTTTLTPGGELRPPGEVLDELLSSWSRVRYEMGRVLDDPRQINPWDRDDDRLEWEPRPDWEYLMIPEPTTDEGRVPGGYPHAHVAIVVDGRVEAERFESVLAAHVQNCAGADPAAHGPDAIDVRPMDEFGSLGSYLFKYLGKSWDSDDMEDYERRFNALIWHEGTRRFRASDGAQRWMKPPEGEESELDWHFAGVANEEQARELRQYETREEFLAAKDVEGLRGWLDGFYGGHPDGELFEAKPVDGVDMRQRPLRRYQGWPKVRNPVLCDTSVGDRPPPGWTLDP